MTIVIHQPEYLPWLGFFDKIDKCDLFVILDHVQFQRGFINRNKIKTPTGWQWLTVPVIHRFPQKIIEVKINNQTNWRNQHWMALTKNYGKAPYFKNYAEFFKHTYEHEWELLVDLDIYLIRNLMKFLGLETPIEISSSLNVKGKSTEMLINICKALGGDTYLSGPGGKNYMSMKKFEEEGIKVIFQEFQYPTYPQRFEKAGFQSHMSIVDLLFNCGEKSLKVIRGAGK